MQATIGSTQVKKVGDSKHGNRVYVADSKGCIWSVSHSDWVMRTSKKFLEREVMFVGIAPKEKYQ